MNDKQREKLLNDALDALREAVMDAEDCGHPLSGGIAANRAKESYEAAKAAIRALAAGGKQR